MAIENNPNANTPILEGAAWHLPADPASLGAAGKPTRDTILPGTNSPAITGFGWRRMIWRMLSTKGT